VEAELKALVEQCRKALRDPNDSSKRPHAGMRPAYFLSLIGGWQ